MGKETCKCKEDLNGYCYYCKRNMLKQTWEEQFREEYSPSHFDIETHIQFIKTTLNNMLEEIVPEELESSDFIGSDGHGYTLEYNDAIKKIKQNANKFIGKK